MCFPKEVNFTPRDVELLVSALKCTKSEITIDYKQFMERESFKNTNSSKAVWHGLKKKLDRIEEGTKITLSASGGGKGKGSGEKRGAVDNEEEGVAAEGGSTPSKAGAKVGGTHRAKKMRPTEITTRVPTTSDYGRNSVADAEDDLMELEH